MERFNSILEQCQTCKYHKYTGKGLLICKYYGKLIKCPCRKYEEKPDKEIIVKDEGKGGTEFET